MDNREKVLILMRHLERSMMDGDYCRRLLAELELPTDQVTWGKIGAEKCLE